MSRRLQIRPAVCQLQELRRLRQQRWPAITSESYCTSDKESRRRSQEQRELRTQRNDS